MADRLTGRPDDERPALVRVVGQLDGAVVAVTLSDPPRHLGAAHVGVDVLPTLGQHTTTASLRHLESAVDQDHVAVLVTLQPPPHLGDVVLHAQGVEVEVAVYSLRVHTPIIAQGWDTETSPNPSGADSQGQARGGQGGRAPAGTNQGRDPPTPQTCEVT